MDRIDMSLDDIIKGNKKKSRQPARTSTGNNNPTNNHGNNNNNNNNNNNRNNRTTGPIRTRSAGKNLTRQKANPYPKPRISKAGNPNGVWRHDLFPTLNSGAQNRNNPKPNNNNNDNNNNNNNNNNNLGLSIRQRLGNGINNTPSGSGVVNRLSIKGAAGNQQARYSIKGEGGPATIIVNNLAPGTSANDIKTAFMEFGEISTMNVDERFPANPVKAELTFESKASALAAIKKYNTALVDGYVLKVQLKQPGNNLNTGTGTATYRAKGKLNKPPVRANGKLYSDQLLSQRNRRVAGGNKGKQSSFGVSY